MTSPARAAPLSILSAAEEAPDRAALVVDGEVLTFASAAARVRSIIGWLDSVGMAALGKRLAIRAERNVDVVLFMYALIERGLPFIPISPALTEAERSQVIERSEAIEIDASAIAAAVSGGSYGSVVRTEVVPDARDLAVPFTSGSMSRPKGVALTRAAFLASAKASESNLGWQDDDRWLLCLSPSHVGGLSVIVRCLVARRTVVLEAQSKFDARAIAEAMTRDRVTLVSLVPAQLDALLDLEPRWHPPAHLRAILLGGARASEQLLARSAERRAPVLTTYGLTEACSQVTTQTYGTTNRGEQGAGMPLDGARLQIVDGVIQVQGPMLMRGYVPEGVHPSPFVDGWLVTNDLGRLDLEGRLHVLGRCDDVIVTGGENVLPSEVEESLETIEGVRAACVFGVEDARWGEVVAAAVETISGSTMDLDLLRTAMRTRLASYKCPRRVAMLNELPRTSSGKIDRAATRLAAQPRLRVL